MGMLRIHCDYCGQAWEVYHRDNWSEPQTRECPHCFTAIDPRTWERVVEAFADMNDANMELLKNHTQEHKPLFTVEYVEDYQFRDRHAETLTDIQAQLYALQDAVEALPQVVVDI